MRLRKLSFLASLIVVVSVVSAYAQVDRATQHYEKFGLAYTNSLRDI